MKHLWKKYGVNNTFQASNGFLEMNQVTPTPVTTSHPPADNQAATVAAKDSGDQKPVSQETHALKVNFI